MTIGASTVWRVRVGGNDANGAGYDSSISGAGTDYSQQDSPQLSVTDIVCANSTTVTSVVGGFTTAMIGNAIRITGGGATSGYYFITARTDTNTITVDRTPGTVAAGTGKVGGACALYKRVLDSLNAAGDKVVPGNTVYIRGSGSDNPGSDDYTTTAHITPVAGDSTSGPVRILGENGRPRIKCDGLTFYLPSVCLFENLYLTVSNYVNGTHGIIRCSTATTVRNVRINTADLLIHGIVLDNAATLIIDNEIFSGTSSPSASGYAGILVSTNAHSCVIKGNRIHHLGGKGITVVSLYCPSISDNLIYANNETGIWFDIYTASAAIAICDNTIDANLGDGIFLSNLSEVHLSLIRGNLITNHNQTGKYGINITSDSATVNDPVAHGFRNNWLYNNTANYHNLTQPATDSVGVDPQYTDRANGDFTLGTNAKAFITDTWRGQTTPIGYREPGAVQRQESGGSVGTVNRIFQQTNIGTY